MKAGLSIVDMFDCFSNNKKKTPNPNVTVALSDRNVQLQSQMPTQQPAAHTDSGAWDHKITRQSHETSHLSSVTTLTEHVRCRQATRLLPDYAAVGVTRCFPFMQILVEKAYSEHVWIYLILEEVE